MLTQRYYKGIWKQNFQRVFSGASPKVSSETQRGNLHEAVSTIREFRNRVAHHEPIFDKPLENYHAQIHNFVGCRSSDAAEWLRGVDPVTKLLKERPGWLDGKISSDG